MTEVSSRGANERHHSPLVFDRDVFLFQSQVAGVNPVTQGEFVGREVVGDFIGIGAIVGSVGLDKLGEFIEQVGGHEE